MPTFIVNHNPKLKNPIKLDALDEKHVLKSLRLKEGQSIQVTDNQGALATATLCDSQLVTFELSDLRQQPEPKELTVCLPLIERSRMEWAIQKLCELNVKTVQLLHTDRCQYPCLVANKFERLNKVATEAQKQSGRAWPMIINNTVKLFDLPLTEQTHILWGDVALKPSEPKDTNDMTTLIVVGPEGGLTADETRWLKKQNSHSLQLGHTVLRAETAAVALATLALY